LYKNHKILAIVLARAGSKGIKNKNLRRINGISLVGRAGIFASKIKYIDLSIVSTDSKIIGKEADKYNLKFLFKRPKNLSGSKISEELVLKNALIETEKKIKKKFDVVVSLAPTSPLRKSHDVIQSIKKLIDNKYDAVWTISETDKKFHPYKSLKLKKDKLKFFSKEGIKVKYRQQLTNTYFRNGAAYVLSRKSVIKKKILPENSSFVISKSNQISIDTLKDLKIAKEKLTR